MIRQATITLLLLAATIVAGCNGGQASIESDCSPGEPASTRSVTVGEFKEPERNRSAWEVYLHDGEVRVRLYEREKVRDPIRVDPLTRYPLGKRTWARVSDGWLLGTHNGEFGSDGLWWFSEDGTESYEIIEGRIKSFVELDGRLLVLEGLEHMMEFEGQVLEVSRTLEGTWHTEQIAAFEGSPHASTIDPDGALVMVTGRRVIRIQPSGEMTILFDALQADGRWLDYPNSIVIVDDVAYIGMRRAVVEIRSLYDDPTIRRFHRRELPDGP
jgi:hypothetical protein